MKIKAIAAMCKKNRRVYLYDRETDGVLTQWVGDGSCMYPIYNMPELDENGICTIFDVPEKDKNKILFNRSSASPFICFEDNDETEEPIQPMEPNLVCGRNVMQPYRTQDGVCFLNTASLKPLDDSLDYLELFSRRSADGSLYIAAKTGLVLQGIIMPVQMLDDTLLSQLVVLTHLVEQEVLAEKMTESEQTTLEETEE